MTLNPLPRGGIRRWWYLAVLPVAVFTPLAYFTEDTALILVLNIVLAAVASAVVSVFTPEACRILCGRGTMDRGELFAYGIWVSWGAIVYSVAETLVWRYQGQPLWLVNSDVTSGRLFMASLAGVFHILKPGELNEKVPLRRNIWIGLLVGLAVALGLGVVERDDIDAAWSHQKAVWYRTPGIENGVAGPPPVSAQRPPSAPRDIVRSPDDYMRRQGEARRPSPDSIPLGDVLGNDDASPGKGNNILDSVARPA